MMRIKSLWMALAFMVLFLSVVFLAGCAKKAGLKEESMISKEQRPAVQAPAKAVTDDKEARERALREQALKDQAAKEAAERAKREAAGKEAAILKELQIPDIHFDFDKSNLKPEAQAILKAGAPAYLKYKIYKLMIEGHCDERGASEYNLALGQRRADEAAKYLIDLGIEKERINTISYGKERPLDPGHDETAWAKNRRAHFVVSQPVK
ncbi:peptidoglycan-associated lipoprotein Pal [bacterium]|nr:MAG: peptidoglycan-associated lipoprotein Pal [bacterium]